MVSDDDDDDDDDVDDDKNIIKCVKPLTVYKNLETPTDSDDNDDDDDDDVDVDENIIKYIKPVAVYKKLETRSKNNVCILFFVCLVICALCLISSSNTFYYF